MADEPEVQPWPQEWNEMLAAAQLVISEIHECVNAGGDWTNVQMALMGFALAIKDQTKKEMRH